MFNVFGRPPAAAAAAAAAPAPLAAGGHAHGAGASAAAPASAAPPDAGAAAAAAAQRWKEALRTARREQERKAERLEEEVSRVKDLAKEHLRARRLGCFRVLLRSCAQGRRAVRDLQRSAIQLEGVQDWLKVQLAMRAGASAMGAAAKMFGAKEFRALTALGVESVIDARQLVAEFRQAGFAMDVQGEELDKISDATLAEDDEMDEVTREMSAEIELEIGQKLPAAASGVLVRPGAAAAAARGAAAAAAGGGGGRVAVGVGGGGGGGGGGPSEADLDREIHAMLATEEGREAAMARL
jgi:hypothetical protein